MNGIACFFVLVVSVGRQGMQKEKHLKINLTSYFSKMTGTKGLDVDISQNATLNEPEEMT